MDNYNKIREINYLNLENTPRYRRIMRYFYLQNLSVNVAMYRDQILEGVRAMGLEDYSEDQLDADLDFLVANRNLTRQQELNQARSIEEFKNQHFRYQITAIGIAIEELMAHLPKDTTVSGDLSAHLFERLLDQLTPMKDLKGVALFDQWQLVVTVFQELQQSAAIYVNYLNSTKVEAFMQSLDFFNYKADFVRYLQIFISEMQRSAESIQETLRQLPEAKLDIIVSEQIKQKQLQPSFEDANSEEIREIVQTQWQGLHNWFLEREGRLSEYRNLIEQTHNVLQRVTRVIQTLTENNQAQQSRTQDYQELIKWFEQIAHQPSSVDVTMEDAQQLAAIVFGIDSPVHIRMDPIDISNQYADLWHETLQPMLLSTKSRKKRQGPKNHPFTRDVKRDAAVVAEHQAEQKAYYAMWRDLFDGGRFQLSHYDNLPKVIRHDLFRYLSTGVAADANLVRTNFGFVLRVTLLADHRITLRFEDGCIDMPDVIFEVTRE